MKRIKITYLILFIFVLNILACEKDSNVNNKTVIEKPSVTFSIEGNQFTSTTGDFFELNAIAKPEGDVDFIWYVDDVKVSTSSTFRYKFTTPGTKKIRFKAENEAGEFTEEFTVNVSDVLIVNLSIGDVDEISRVQNDELEVIALVSAGADIQHTWEVDGVIVSRSRILDNFILSQSKTYHVKYTAVNLVGTFVKEFEVKILGLPLAVSFDLTSQSVRKLRGENLNITATIMTGEAGAVHEWKVNQTIVSTLAELSYLCNQEGTYEVSYRCVNAIGNVVSRTWSLTVVVGSYLVDNFESGTLDIKFKAGIETAVLGIIDNPLKSGINTSNKVLRLTNSYASQQLNVYTKRASNPQVDISAEIYNKGFNRIRFMYYSSATTGRKVTWKINGNDPIIDVTLQPTFGQWSYAVIELTTSQVNSLTSMNLRLNDVISGSGATNSASDIVYIDNLEFYNSELVQ